VRAVYTITENVFQDLGYGHDGLQRFADQPTAMTRAWVILERDEASALADAKKRVQEAEARALEHKAAREAAESEHDSLSRDVARAKHSEETAREAAATEVERSRGLRAQLRKLEGDLVKVRAHVGDKTWGEALS